MATPRRRSRLAAGRSRPSAGGNLSGRIALVTGAGRGLGRAMAIALAQAGASVILWGRQASHLQQTSRAVESLGGAALIQRVDVTNPAAVRQAVSRARRRFGRIDVLVNNAGIWDGDPFLTLSRQAWTRVMDTDLTSVFTVSQAVARVMVRQGAGLPAATRAAQAGSIINISSTSGILAHPHGAAYCAAKAGVMHLTRVMAVELGPHGIRVNSIAPGLFHTAMTADVFADRAWIAKRRAQIPLRRFGDPEDLAGLVVFLASDASRHITGQTIVIDGGASLVVGA